MSTPHAFIAPWRVTIWVRANELAGALAAARRGAPGITDVEATVQGNEWLVTVTWTTSPMDHTSLERLLWLVKGRMNRQTPGTRSARTTASRSWAVLPASAPEPAAG